MTIPSWYALALAERGVKEAPGAANNPKVQAYYRDAAIRASGTIPCPGAPPLSARS